MSENRKHLEEKYTWDLSTIYASDAAWETEYQSLSQDLEQAGQYAGHLLDSASTLLAATDLYMSLIRRLEKLYVYAHMKNDQDTTVGLYQEYQAKAASLYSQFSGAFAYFEPEFMAITVEQLAAFTAEETGLELYAHYYERLLANKDHVLSQEAEELLAAAGDIFDNPNSTYNVLDNADIVFPWVPDGKGDVIELTHGNFITLMESKDREVRKAAYEGLFGTYEQYQHTYAQTLQGLVKVHNYKAKVRHYDSARQAALAANFIPESVYDALLESVNKHLPLLHRYLDLRKKVLGLDELKMYDMYAPLSETETAMTYEEALDKAEQVLVIFGQEYSQGVHRAFTERWIDVHPNKGKRSGAYSGGAYDTNAFMLLNWQDTLDNLFTLVHETGHSLHSTFTRQTQPYVYGDYPIFLAEIASTTNENILTETLLKEVEDDKTRFAILNHYLDGFKGTVFRQTQFAEFEHAIHEADANGQVLTADYMTKLYAELNEKYYGLKSEDNYEIQFEWERIPHFYMNYYVYQYATGFAAASYLADKIVHGSDADKEAYLNYLKAGSSDYPLEVIKKAGVDMTDTAYLDAAFKVFEDRLNELEALVEKGVHLS